jgi:predicted dehydrogenase
MTSERTTRETPLTSGGSRLRSRRDFLRAAGGATAIVAAPAFLTSALSASPNEAVVTGHIGVGGRGSSLLDMCRGHAGIRIAAVCDVDRRHAAEAKAKVGGSAELSGDYRRILERDDIDAVVIATPDHWHCPITIAACRAKKDVYVEKPLSQNVAEGRAAVEAAREHGRVVQVGINHRSASYNREIARIIRGGRIGKIREVRNWMWTNPRKPRTAPIAAPEDLDWDFWLGPTPEVAYHPERSHYNFRWCRDYAGGYMTDWGVHMFNVVTCAMDVDHKGPDTVEASGEFAPDNLYDFPMKMEARWEYSDPDFVLAWTQPSENGAVLPGQKYAMTFVGEDGELRTGFGDEMYKFYRDGKEEPLPREGRSVDVPESPGHLQNWLDCIRTRERPIADVEIGHRTTLTCLIANIALFSGAGKLRWDWRNERFLYNATANEWLGRESREKYRI